MNSTDEQSESFVSPRLETLVRLQGSATESVLGVELLKLTFSYTSETYMYLESYSTMLEGGDYAVHKGAAVHADGVDSFSVDGCKFAETSSLYSFVRTRQSDRVDLTTLIDSMDIADATQVRRSVISDCEFVRIGAHAILSWGTSAMVNGTGPDHPHGTRVVGNFAHEIGIQEK